MTDRALTFSYKNHRGEVSVRRVEPVGIWYGVTDWHPKPQWLMKALDLDKQEFRDFAMSDMAGWGTYHHGGDV